MEHNKPRKRKEKIKILEDIRDGRIPIDYLKPPKDYVFIQVMGEPDKFQMDGETFSRREVEEFERNVELKNLKLNRREDQKKDVCIIIEFKKGFTIL